MVIAIMHKVLDKWSMVGIRVIHNTKINEVSKHMSQVQENPSITCMGCSEDSMALNTMGRAIVHSCVRQSSQSRDKQWDMGYVKK